MKHKILRQWVKNRYRLTVAVTEGNVKMWVALKRLSGALASCCNRGQLSARSLFNRTWRGVSPPRARNSSRFLSGTCNWQRELYFSFFRNKCVPSLWVQWIAIIRNRNSWQLTRTPAPGNVFADFGLNKGHCADFLRTLLRICVCVVVAVGINFLHRVPQAAWLARWHVVGAH